MIYSMHLIILRIRYMDSR